jgi:2-(1,2-epoxy-1,2-dihydrophenyl)acetyl-CoA isomerase
MKERMGDDTAGTAGTADDEVLLERDDAGVAWVTLNRPDSLNALTPDNRSRLADLFAGFAEADDVRAIVLTGTGRGFCAGADLKNSRATSGDRPMGPEVAASVRHGAHDLVLAMMNCPKPIVGAINGVAAGVGVQLALACDLLIAADDARFVQVFARRGLIPDGGAVFLLPRLIGLAKAKELLFLGDDVHAPEALALGLVNRVVPGDELLDAARALAHRLASGPTFAIGLTKTLVHRSLDVDFATSLTLEAHMQATNSGTDDVREGLMSFVERRRPEFRGR